MDTDVMSHLDADKSGPAAAATAALDGLEQGLIEALADEQTRAAKAALPRDRGVAAAR
jgi:hypothetical protein